MKFLTVFNPSLQTKVASNIERAYKGTAPTLTAIKFAYSEKILNTWLMAQLENLNDFCNVKEKMTVPQMKEIAGIITVEYHYLKITEVMLFFHRFKSGKLGELYGSVDPLRIMSALNEFMKQRFQELSIIDKRIENEELTRKRAEWAKNCITREEYLKNHANTKESNSYEK